MKLKPILLTVAVLASGLCVLYWTTSKNEVEEIANESSKTLKIETSETGATDSNYSTSDEKRPEFNNANTKNVTVKNEKNKVSQMPTKHRYQQYLPHTEVISEKKLWESIRSLGNKDGHLFAAFLLASKEEKVKYLQLLNELHADSELFLEAYLMSHNEIETKKLKQLNKRFPNNLNLNIRYIKNLIHENSVEETVSKLLQIDNQKSINVADVVYKSMRQIYEKAELPDESSEIAAGLGLLEKSINNIDTTIIDAIKPWDIIDPEWHEAPDFSRQLSKQYDKETRSKLIEKYAEYSKNTGHLLGRIIANALQSNKYQLENGEEPKGDHPLSKESECLSKFSKLALTPEELTQEELLKYLKVNAYQGEYRAMLQQPEIQKITTGACSKYLK